MKLALADRRFFPPTVAAHLVKPACELPDQAERFALALDVRGPRADPSTRRAFDTWSGAVTGICRKRKRQEEFIELLEVIDRDIPSSVMRIHVVCDNWILHKGKKVRAWLAEHPRFRFPASRRGFSAQPALRFQQRRETQRTLTSGELYLASGGGGQGT